MAELLLAFGGGKASIGTWGFTQPARGFQTCAPQGCSVFEVNRKIIPGFDRLWIGPFKSCERHLRY